MRHTNMQLAAVLDELKTLHGLLPICAHCKGIRNDEGYWQTVETYIRSRTDANFTHGICPACAEKNYPELFRKKQAASGS